MTPRQKRMVTVAAILVGVGIATTFALKAFNQNLLYYYSPTQVAAGEAPSGKTIRVGGMVQQNSIKREPGSLDVSFSITDFNKEVPVTYTGILPDLFREGQGTIARGKFDDGRFVAEEVLAKHDENYMPPEVQESLKPHMDALNNMPQNNAASAPAAPGT
jgi:cytochrome c-type biogenesis protein CcmE